MSTESYRPTEEEYVAGVKYELCKQLGLKDGEGCGDNPDCLTSDVCRKCGRHLGVLTVPEYYEKL